MLIFTRNPEEGFIIQTSDGPIIVRYLSRHGDAVKLGIEAAREIPVHRLEVHDKIQAQATCNHSFQLATASSKKNRRYIQKCIACGLEKEISE